MLATDNSAAALDIAARNASAHGFNHVVFREGDWYEALLGERFDLIVSNPPYIAVTDPHLTQGDLRFEPPSALISGGDGLDALRILTAGHQHIYGQGLVSDGAWLGSRCGHADITAHGGIGGSGHRARLGSTRPRHRGALSWFLKAQRYCVSYSIQCRPFSSRHPSQRLLICGAHCGRNVSRSASLASCNEM